MTRFLHSRYAVFVSALLFVMCMIAYGQFGNATYPTADDGLIKGWDSQWISDKWLNIGVSIILNLLVGFLVGYLNRMYNVLRAMTWLQSLMFFVLQLSTPALFLHLYPGILLALTVVLGMFLMYISFNNPDAQRNVFLLFFILSVGSTFDYSFLVYVPVFMIACAQMRIFTLRTVLAALLGLATPWVILFGFGIIDFSDLQMPKFYHHGDTAMSWLIGVAAFTSFISTSAWVQSFMKILTYNGQSRAYLSVVTITMFFTIIASAVDFTHVGTFLPVLNCCAALMVAHLFATIYTYKRSFFAILSIILIYLILYSWRLAICIS